MVLRLLNSLRCRLAAWILRSSSDHPYALARRLKECVAEALC